jgi:hypothetical protein
MLASKKEYIVLLTGIVRETTALMLTKQKLFLVKWLKDTPKFQISFLKSGMNPRHNLGINISDLIVCKLFKKFENMIQKY